MGDRIRKWIAVLLAGSILAMIQLVPAGGAVFVRENIENKEILGEKETSLQQPLHARAWVLMDADSGRILAGKDADTAYPMASTTKILTCILALEQGNPDDWVEVSEKAASMPDVQLNMRAGERYRLSDLLYSLMLESHNDSAVAVAEHIGGSVEEFAEKMNRKAREIGCKNVCFVTPEVWTLRMRMETNTALRRRIWRGSCATARSSRRAAKHFWKLPVRHHGRFRMSRETVHFTWQTTTRF